VLPEVQQTVDDVVIIARGRLVQASPLSELAGAAARTVHVVTPDRPRLLAVLASAGLSATELDGGVVVRETSPAEVGRLAFAGGVELHELRRQDEGLEQTFLRLVGDEQEVAR
jgi:ABC-2 type transport system ATP-binding protein